MYIPSIKPQEPLQDQGLKTDSGSYYATLQRIASCPIRALSGAYSIIAGSFWREREIRAEPNLTPNQEYQRVTQFHQIDDPTLFQIAHLNIDRNRYGNVLPNEPTRFKLDHDKSFYFNANWVMGGEAVACQGPLPEEVDEFWRMVWHGGINTIVMLANPIEQGRSKCSEYWKERIGFRGPEVEATTLREERIYMEGDVGIYERKIQLKGPGNETRIITQYHLQNWPDFGVVSPNLLAQLVQIVSENKGEGPLLAHCSAGIGRTGTFLATYQAYQEKTNNLYRIAIDLRDPQKGRVGMIQTPEQYALAKETISLLVG